MDLDRISDLPPPNGEIVRRSPYRLPPHLDLSAYMEEDIVEDEIIAELVPAQDSPDPLPHFDIINDDEQLALEGSQQRAQDDSSVDVHGPESEKPAGVRVQWKRPTELFAEAGAKCTGLGIDFIAATHQRFFDRLRTDDVLAEGEAPRGGLAPMNPFESEDPFTLDQRRRFEPAPFETLARES